MGYVIFYMLPDPASRALIAANPLTIFYIWQGGMAFHGGLIGVALALWWFARKRNVSLLGVGDLAAQTAQAFRNVEAALAAAGLTPADVAKSATDRLLDRCNSRLVRRSGHRDGGHPSSPVVTCRSPVVTRRDLPVTRRNPS